MLSGKITQHIDLSRLTFNFLLKYQDYVFRNIIKNDIQAVR